MLKNKDDIELLAENEQLRKEIELLKSQNEIHSKLNKGIIGGIKRWYLGKRLDKSIVELYKELIDGKVKIDTLSEVTISVVRRITRLSIFVIIIGLLPALFTFWQAIILKEQTKRIEVQNQLINIQTATPGFQMLNGLFDKINFELFSSKINNDKLLSQGLVNEIISISNFLQPYAKLNNKNGLSNLGSPERGTLLLFLSNSEINNKSMSQILERSNFDYAVFNEVVLRNITMNSLILNKLQGDLRFHNCDFEKLFLSNFNSTSIHITKSNVRTLQGTNNTVENLHVLDSEVRTLEMNLSNYNVFGSKISTLKLKQGAKNILIQQSRIDDIYCKTADYVQFVNSSIKETQTIVADSIDFNNIKYEIRRYKSENVKFFGKNSSIFRCMTLDSLTGHKVISPGISTFNFQTDVIHVGEGRFWFDGADQSEGLFDIHSRNYNTKQFHWKSNQNESDYVIYLGRKN